VAFGNEVYLLFQRLNTKHSSVAFVNLREFIELVSISEIEVDYLRVYSICWHYFWTRNFKHIFKY